MGARVSDLGALAKAHEIVKNHLFLSAIGFPCQLYSSQGAQRRSSNRPAQTLPIALRNYCLLGLQAIITECISGAASNNEFKEICEVMNCRMQEVHLNLNSQCSMNRARWWILLVPEVWNLFQLRTWPLEDPRPVECDFLPKCAVGILATATKTWNSELQSWVTSSIPCMEMIVASRTKWCMCYTASLILDHPWKLPLQLQKSTVTK